MTRDLQPAIAAGYIGVLPHLVEAARSCGYALGVHGSMRTDLDLIAAPWTDEATDAETLIATLVATIGHAVLAQADRNGGKANPHGRRSFCIFLAVGGPYLDVSVMPRGAP